MTKWNKCLKNLLKIIKVFYKTPSMSSLNHKKIKSFKNLKLIYNKVFIKILKIFNNYSINNN